MTLVDLSGKTALVTGGAHGLGAGIAEALVEAGAAVLVTDIDAEGCQKLAARLEQNGGRAAGRRLDVTNEDDVKQAIEAGWNTFGRLDILVNNAGIVSLKDALDLTLPEWDRTFQLNVRALFRCSQLFAQRLSEEKRGGAIVNIASNAGKVGYVGQVHYNATKATVINITQSLAKEWASLGINVNAVCPGAVDTEMLHQCMLWTIDQSGGKLTVDELRKAWAPAQLGRLIQPVEVGRVVAFLASDAAAIIRGQSISVDAGTTPW
jgi:meso-butanediol dehydrogenase/(S,S)-butanediol dehydrogenase/diacetyl reductase